MIVSHEHKLIFIKNGKTAGTSIEVFLSTVCEESAIVTPIYPSIATHRPRNHAGFYNRMPASEIREKLGPTLWDRYYKFCVERNPWEKALSYYYMEKYRLGGRLSLDEYLSGDIFPVNYSRYTEPGNPGQIIVDRVIEYECLSEGLSEVFSRAGVPFKGRLNVYAKAEYRNDHRPYQEVLSPAQAERIRDLFAVEIALHGYQFDSFAKDP